MGTCALVPRVKARRCIWGGRSERRAGGSLLLVELQRRAKEGAAPPYPNPGPAHALPPLPRPPSGWPPEEKMLSQEGSFPLPPWGSRAWQQRAGGAASPACRVSTSAAAAQMGEGALRESSEGWSQHKRRNPVIPALLT